MGPRIPERPLTICHRTSFGEGSAPDFVRSHDVLLAQFCVAVRGIGTFGEVRSPRPRDARPLSFSHFGPYCFCQRTSLGDCWPVPSSGSSLLILLSPLSLSCLLLLPPWLIDWVGRAPNKVRSAFQQSPDKVRTYSSLQASSFKLHSNLQVIAAAFRIDLEANCCIFALILTQIAAFCIG